MLGCSYRGGHRNILCHQFIRSGPAKAHRAADVVGNHTSCVVHRDIPIASIPRWRAIQPVMTVAVGSIGHGSVGTIAKMRPRGTRRILCSTLMRSTIQSASSGNAVATPSPHPTTHGPPRLAIRKPRRLPPVPAGDSPQAISEAINKASLAVSSKGFHGGPAAPDQFDLVKMPNPIQEARQHDRRAPTFLGPHDIHATHAVGSEMTISKR